MQKKKNGGKALEGSSDNSSGGRVRRTRQGRELRRERYQVLRGGFVAEES